jgi:hypothetical protein
MVEIHIVTTYAAGCKDQKKKKEILEVYLLSFPCPVIVLYFVSMEMT